MDVELNTAAGRLAVAVFVASVLAPIQPAAQIVPSTLSAAAGEIRADRIRAHMAFLADDRLEGRETGTRGFDLAAQYVATQFQELGLRPRSGSYLQRMDIRRARVDETQSSLTLTRGGTAEPLVYGKDFVTYGETAEEDVQASGEIVFVGDGVTAERRGVDAYRGLNAVGKIVVAMPGSPPGLPPSETSYFEDAQTKSANAASHGATALLLVAEEHIPWELRVRAARQLGSSEWLPEHRAAHVKAVAYLNRTTAEKMLGQRLDRPALRPGADLGSAVLRVRNRLTNVRSANVYALLTGSDQTLSSEYVVFTAHLDHVGIGDSVNGDAIYNGAVDNASGVAALLTMARAFASMPTRPARSVLFVATTGEEQGDIGSDYFVHHAPAPIDRIVACLNVDGVSFTTSAEVEVGGGANSSLGTRSEEAARQIGLKVRNEPIGLGGSDHSPFLEAGIPVLWIGAALTDDWMNTRYHTPPGRHEPASGLRGCGALHQAGVHHRVFVRRDSSTPTMESGRVLR